MLYIILGVYIAVAAVGIAALGVCAAAGQYAYCVNILIALFSYAGVCGTATAGFYSAKAAKENEIQLANSKYRMRLDIAKEIFAEYGSALDENSVNLLRQLMSDEGIAEDTPVNVPAVNISVPDITVQPSAKDDDGLG